MRSDVVLGSFSQSWEVMWWQEVMAIHVKEHYHGRNFFNYEKFLFSVPCICRKCRDTLEVDTAELFRSVLEWRGMSNTPHINFTCQDWPCTLRPPSSSDLSPPANPQHYPANSQHDPSPQQSALQQPQLGLAALPIYRMCGQPFARVPFLFLAEPGAPGCPCAAGVLRRYSRNALALWDPLFRHTTVRRGPCRTKVKAHLATSQPKIAWNVPRTSHCAQGSAKAHFATSKCGCEN